MHLVLLAHHIARGKPGSILPDYEAALERAGIDTADVELCAFVAPGNGLSSSYHTLAAKLRKGGRILPQLLVHVGALLKLDAYESIGLVTWSAPYGLAQDLLAIEADRDALAYWVACDSGYGPITPGVADFARLARDRRKLYSAFYTDVRTSGYDDSGTFLKHVQLAAGAPTGLFSVEHLAHDEAAYRAKLAGLTGEARSKAASRFWENEHIAALHVGPRALAAAFTTLGFTSDPAAPSSRPAIPPPPPISLAGGNVLPPASGEPRTLRRGMHGDDVRELQTQLNQLGAKLHVDGDLGGLTELAVRSFQVLHHVGADGAADKSTRTAIAIELALLVARTNADTEPTGDDRVTDVGEGVPAPAPSSPSPFRLRCLARAISELGVHETPGTGTTPRVAEYLAGCVRGDRLLKLAGDEPAWCAALIGWTMAREAIPGDVVPPWRAAVTECWADANRIGKAHPMSWTPRPGDLAVFGRGVGGVLRDPRVGGAGHIAFVELVPNAAGNFGIVGGNQGGEKEHGGAVTRETRSRTARELVGWIEVG